MNNENMNKETRSVIDFLLSSKDILDNYFELVKCGGGHSVSYSGLVSSGIISGTTKEDVNFESVKVQRSTVTEFLQERFSEEVLSEL